MTVQDAAHRRRAPHAAPLAELASSALQQEIDNAVDRADAERVLSLLAECARRGVDVELSL